VQGGDSFERKLDRLTRLFICAKLNSFRQAQSHVFDSCTSTPNNTVQCICFFQDCVLQYLILVERLFFVQWVSWGLLHRARGGGHEKGGEKGQRLKKSSTHLCIGSNLPLGGDG